MPEELRQYIIKNHTADLKKLLCGLFSVIAFDYLFPFGLQHFNSYDKLFAVILTLIAVLHNILRVIVGYGLEAVLSGIESEFIFCYPEGLYR